VALDHLFRDTSSQAEDSIDSHQVTLALACVILVFLVLGAVIASKTPAYESPDEPSHVQNIETLVSGHWYSMNAPCNAKYQGISLTTCSGDEAQQAPLYYLLFAGWQKVVGLPARAPYRGQANFLDGEKTGAFLHHSPADLRFLLWLRLPNVVLGALTVLFTFFAVRLATPDAWTPVIAAALVAFMPRFVFLSSFVTNDNLVDLLGAVLVFLALRFSRAPSRWRMAAVGIVSGLLTTTKLSALPVALVVVVLAILVQGWRRRAMLMAVGYGSALLVSGWYLVQNMVRYGDPLARKATAHYLSLNGGLGTFLKPYTVTDPLRLIFVQVPYRILHGFWYQSGAVNQFRWSWPVIALFCFITAGALAGLIHRQLRRETLVPLVAISGIALLSVWVVAFQTATYEARLAFVGLTAMAALAALGLERWRAPYRFLLPAMGLVGTLVAIQQNVLAVHWTT
jgi:Dolichyl-phosphate-mannose-protein mannosyltransferase